MTVVNYYIIMIILLILSIPIIYWFINHLDAKIKTKKHLINDK